ncbi:probable 20S rRNA accumulation protein 4 [Nicotiana tomentosiformis]|uniref:probable 20S rRNA accumulation protein 4 n=1 Tax=Nicotiana tomentosiformis TaxID=4098 RepID=UPI00051B3A12|nr:probable 20S rRNA accumulation protein 4 [Nicotiana tomentosiformis]XP_009601588.1 probable 20S rRNA accumulation protein 4 [Nicotiana tomentosiformis]XP_009601589.1 probable 20S rRNA accumulation protein 4 [Nicotiana tomentosiformis]XP_018626563.1 probable 20S rRNA accumulation protein 4 [Nicotiana tomentosiformis]XP_033512203.1 probable 20S rRNA accumulation protein 4 [Nicotiana tomentosiformis]
MGGVFLGMPGSWAGHIHEAADHYTTKIGGLPDWPIPLPTTCVDLLKCCACKTDLCLLAQVYAPISKKNLNIEERAIYVFGCLTPECGSGPVSWRAIRIQKSLRSEGLKSQSYKDVASPVSSVSDPKKDRKKDIWTFDSSEEDDDDEDEDDIDLAELARALSEAATVASHSKKQICGHQVTAETSTPNRAIRATDEKTPVIPCFYIYTEEEKFSKKDVSVSSKGILSPIKDKENDPDTPEETWEVEDYEYDRALNADRIYLKFKKRLDAYPEQCFRYSYGGKPLLASGNAVDPGTCRLCGASRHYEMQLMPPLLYFLQEAVSEKERPVLDNWNWMTLIVYTCSQNCSEYHQNNSSEDGWIVAEEAVVVQYE